MAAAFEAWERRRLKDALFGGIEEATRLAEELTWPPTAGHLADRIRNELVPSMLQARTYVEVGELHAPEIREHLVAARQVAADLADADRSLAVLFSRLRTLVEEADNAAKL